MMNLMMTCLRLQCTEPEVVSAVFRGDLGAALRLARRGQHGGRDEGVDPDAARGQLLGRILIALGQAEEAEEVFNGQLRRYEALPRPRARCLGSLDRAVLESSQNRSSRAAEHFNTVADDEAAPTELRIEALAGLAGAIHGVSDPRRVHDTIEFALRLASRPGFDERSRLLAVLQLDFEVRDRLSGAAGRFPQRVNPITRMAAGCDDEGLRAAIAGCSHLVPDAVMLRERFRLLAVLLAPASGAGDFAAGVREVLNRLRGAQHLAAEEGCRIDAALACIARGANDFAEELLAPLTGDEAGALRHRRAVDLTLCLSHLHSARGRHAEALRLLREHTDRALDRMRRGLPMLPQSRFLERCAVDEHAEAAELQLPLRYRKAYRYIIEHLGDRLLSIRHVAAHIDVTERALQMAFRAHLGMTPGELIRRRRMEHIRLELLACAGRETVFDVASRWGIPSRSTFAQNYRQQFGEAPSSTLRGLQ